MLLLEVVSVVLQVQQSEMRSVVAMVQLLAEPWTGQLELQLQQMINRKIIKMKSIMGRNTALLARQIKEVANS